MKNIPSKARMPGFTLVELLVVIGIIAMLIAMLLPVLSKARETATTIKCASNMREMGTTITYFANANGGRCPGQLWKWSGSYFAQVYGWQDVLNLLYFNKKVGEQIPQYQSQNATAKMACPEVRLNSASARVYTMNIYANGGPGIIITGTPAATVLAYGSFREPTIFGSTFATFDASNPTTGTYEYWLGAKLSGFKNASEKLLLAETERSIDVLYPGTSALSAPTLGDYATAPYWSAGQGYYSFRHNRYTTMNVLFVDNHVESFKADRGSKKIDSRLYSAAITRMCQVTP